MTHYNQIDKIWIQNRFLDYDKFYWLRYCKNSWIHDENEWIIWENTHENILNFFDENLRTSTVSFPKVC